MFQFKTQCMLTSSSDMLNIDIIRKCIFRISYLIYWWYLGNWFCLIPSIHFWHVLFQICSLSTIVREYVAMRSISSLPFKDLILKAADIDDITEDQAWKLSKPLKEYIESTHNNSQLEAIYVSSYELYLNVQDPREYWLSCKITRIFLYS